MTGDERPPFSVAVIADAHFHDIDGDYGFPAVEIGKRRLSLYSWARTRESTRVFNESAGALSVAIAQILERGVRHVVLLGDYTDDGQRATTESLAGRLADLEARHGLCFYALPGNHDGFGPFGRHRSGDFLLDDGRSVFVTSDDREPPQGAVVTAGFRCEGYPAAQQAMARFGYFRRPEFLHWESPFGTDDAADTRTYEAVSADGRNRYRLMDASYLVEPEDGLWLLMIDANVFEPKNGAFSPHSKQAFKDSTSAGWNAMLRAKPFILGWMADVAARAKAQGKTLLTFSHYPVIDPLDDVDGYEARLFPKSPIMRRLPRPEVAAAVAGAGIRHHFSGHWHVAGVSAREIGSARIENFAVPSLCGFPPGFAFVAAQGAEIAVDLADLSALPVDPDIMMLYAREATQTGDPDAAVLASQTYGVYLRHHAKALVQHRYFPREWPAEVIDLIAPMRLAELLTDERTSPAPGAIALLQDDEERSLPVLTVIADWYCLRQASTLALEAFGSRRIDLLERIAHAYVDGLAADEETPVLTYLKLFFSAFLSHLARARKTKPPGP